MSVQEAVWTEKYRPQEFDDIIGHEDIKSRMKEFVDDPEMPNLLLAGPQGTGKTAMTQVLSKQKYGDNWRSNLLELNASDERGIDVVRDKIKGFARQGTVDADFKIIFLDEADQLTSDAQPALRTIMEDFSDVTRFILSCNYPNQIIDPIQSRCAPFYFGRLQKEDIRKLIIRVLTGEGIDYDDALVDKLASEARGDGRKAITLIQVAVDRDAGELRDDWAEIMVSAVDRETVSEVVDLSLRGELDDAMEILDKNLIKEGIDHQTLCDSFLNEVKHNTDIPQDARAKIIDKIGDCDYRIMYGANPNIQFHSLLTEMHAARHVSLYPDE